MTMTGQNRITIDSTTARFCARLLACALTLSLAGCFDDDKKSDSMLGSLLSVPSAGAGPTAPPTSGTSNKAPTISGNPVTVAKNTLAYSFQPTASDADGDKLSFTISGKPDWATFDATTGRLTGTPAEGTSGTYANVQIGVTDGKDQAALPAFAITVTAPVVGSATLTWLAPEAYEDGTPLLDLSGYVVRYGREPTTLDKSIRLDNAGITSVVVENLVEGTWYFTLSSVNRSGVESRPTGSIATTIS
jgi:hypothetical protein